MSNTAKNTSLALLIGTLAMLLIDFGMGKITNSFYAVPFSVFAGAFIAGILVNKNAWVIGLLIGLVNSMMLIIIYYKLGPQDISLFKLALYPVLYSISCGLIGGIAASLISKKYHAQKSSINA